MMDLVRERFEKALEAVIGQAKCREGIGCLGEKLLHATLKCFYEPNTDCHEVKVAGFVADIYKDGAITEIQTGSFTPLKRKLEVFLSEYDVTVVHPIVNTKRVIWINGEGEFSKPVKSPKKRDIFGAFAKIVSILPYLLNGRFTLILAFLDVEEYRILHPKYQKRRATKYETLPTAYCGETVLKTPADYAALLPTSLGDSFTSEEFSRLCKVRGRALSASLKVFLTLGVLSREKVGRGYRYHREI